jgi:hypothetical protein
MVRASQIQAASADRISPAVCALPETIEAITGATSFVDLSFPRASLAGNPAFEATRVLRLPHSEIERHFLQRFRQSGGHAPIATIDLDDEFTWPPQLLRTSGSVVVSFEDVDAAMAAEKYLHGGGSPILCPATTDDRLLSSNSREYRRVRLVDCNGGPSYFLFLPRLPLGRLESADRPEGTPRTDDVDFSAASGNVVIEARSVLHDGGYVSEGDLRYSWLWTGPSTHFRLIFPQIAGVRPRLAELCIPRTEEDTNLDRLTVQLDGRTIVHRLDRWSATSGKVGVDIPRGSDYCVLTLVVPKPTHDANSGRLLGLCIDKLILTP